MKKSVGISFDEKHFKILLQLQKEFNFKNTSETVRACVSAVYELLKKEKEKKETPESKQPTEVNSNE